jgi:hypothetical protein
MYWLRLVADTVDFGRERGKLYVQFEGGVEGVFTGSIVRTSLHGDGLDDSTGEVEVAGRFSLAPGWNLASLPGAP